MQEKEVVKEKSFPNSTINLINRKTLTISGVEKVFELTPQKIQLKVSGSLVIILGENQTVTKLDVETGEISIEGQINDIKFTSSTTKSNLFKRLFK